MAELRYRAGNIRDPGVHKIGIIALGSHLENHGPALPIDTDAKIGAHIAFQSSLLTGAKFLGIIFPAYELDTIDHGIHVSLDELKENVITTYTMRIDASAFGFIEEDWDDDPDHKYAYIENNKELVMIQDFAFGKLLKPADYYDKGYVAPKRTIYFEELEEIPSTDFPF